MAHEEQDYIDGWQTYSNWIDDSRERSDVFRRYGNELGADFNIGACETTGKLFEMFWTNNDLRKEATKLYARDSLRLIAKRQRSNTTKSHAISKSKRDVGNQFFKKADFREAVKQYTQAVKFAPYPSNVQGDTKVNDSDTLALALANRSAALYSLTRYRLCLADIDLALKYGYPEANKFKLLIRKVKCLHVLSVWANDVEQIKEDLRAMMKKANTPEYIKTEIQSMFEFLDQTQPEDVEKDESDIEDETIIKISNVSKLLPQAADCVEMSCDPDTERGRYLLTNKDISFGRLLIAEDPFVSNLAPSKRDQHCYHCFGRLYSCGLACESCTQISYCSLDCLEAGKNIHSYECSGLLDFQDHLGVAYLVTHIMFKIKFNVKDVQIHTRKNVETKSLEAVLNIPHSNWPDLVYKNDYASVLSLMDHISDMDSDELFSYSITAAYLLQAVIEMYSSKHPECFNSKEAELVMGSVILKHLLQLRTNLISILDQNLQNLVPVGHSISDIEERPIGVGLYPTVALLNHSCQPNILSIFHKNKFVARASRGLECGTEINYCYGPSMSRMSKRDRQKCLKDQYFFTCSCDCCANDIENHSRALVCPKCQGPVIYNQDLSHKCMDCKQENVLEPNKYIIDIQRLQLNLNKLRVSDDSYQTKMGQLRSIEANLRKLIYWRHPLFVQVKSQLIQLAEEQEDLEAASKYSKEELELIGSTFGENSMESILNKLKCINLDWKRLYYNIEDSKSEEEKESSIEELKLLLATTSTTRGRLKDLLNSTSILGAETTFDGELKFLSGMQTNINKYLTSLVETSESGGGPSKVADSS